MARTGYAKLSNSFWVSTKIKKLRKHQPSALIVYILAISYCSDNLTDGHLTDDDIYYQLDATDDDINALCDVRLLEPDGDGGFFLHDYLEYQMSKEEVEKKAEDSKRRVQEWRSKRKENGNADVTPLHVRGNASVTDKPRTKNQEPNTTTPPTPSRGGVEDDPKFNEFMEAYPKPGNHTATLKAWHELVDSGLSDPDTLIASAKQLAKQWRQTGQEVRYAPAPKNFLSEGAWQKFQPKATIQLPDEYWIQEHLTLKLPSGTDSVRARQELFRMIHEGTTPDSAAESIITEASAQKILREAA